MSIKEKLNRKRAKVLADCTCMALDMKNSTEKTMSRNPELMALAGSAGMVMSSVMTMAASAGEIQTKIGNLLESIFKLILGVSTGLAVTMAAYHLLCCFTGNAKKTEMHVDALKKIVIVWVAINSIGLIINFVYPLVKGGGFAGNQSTQKSFS